MSKIEAMVNKIDDFISTFPPEKAKEIRNCIYILMKLQEENQGPMDLAICIMAGLIVMKTNATE